MATEVGKVYEVTAVPFEGFTTFRRAGRSWSTTPTRVTVRSNDTKPEDLKDDEITEAQFEQLAADRTRINITEENSEVARVRRQLSELEAKRADLLTKQAQEEQRAQATAQQTAQERSRGARPAPHEVPADRKPHGG
jgi:hypothetical protein